jgi:protocatechuate 3,4-dioxygenase, beta subunit
MTAVPTLGEEGLFYQRDRLWHPPAFTPGYKSTTLRAPRHALLSLPTQTGSERTGPAFGHSRLQPLDNDLIHNFSPDGGEAIGQRMIVYGQVLDENARPVRDTLVEFWQANAGGRYRHKREGYQAALDPNFGGCGRAITDDNGYYHFRTIYPLFGVRARLRAAPHHADVFRGRSHDLAGPNRAFDPRPRCG